MPVQDIYRAVLDFNRERVIELVDSELTGGTDVSTILHEGLIAPMDEVGRRFSEAEMFIPEMLMAAEAMKAGLEMLRPLLSSTDAKPRGTVVIGTVKGDLHDIGKNLVSMMLEGAGFKVIDLGVDVDGEKFIAAAKDNHADILAMSALLTTTMPAMESIITAVTRRNLSFKCIIGGAPVRQEFAARIGADGYSADAPGAVELARGLMEG